MIAGTFLERCRACRGGQSRPSLTGPSQATAPSPGHVEQELQRAKAAQKVAEEAAYRSEEARLHALKEAEAAKKRAADAERQAAWNQHRAEEEKREAQRLVAEATRGINLYEVLGLQPHCSVKDVKDAYRKLAKTVHPDKVDKDESVQTAAARFFRQLQEAYEVLSDDAKRRGYDRECGLRFCIGDRVCLNGLQQAPQYNGTYAEVMEEAPAGAARLREQKLLYVSPLPWQMELARS